MISIVSIKNHLILDSRFLLNQLERKDVKQYDVDQQHAYGKRNLGLDDRIFVLGLQ